MPKVIKFIDWRIVNILPEQIGLDSLHDPIGPISAVPPQVLFPVPSRKNPISHIKVATVPKSNGSLLSGL